MQHAWATRRIHKNLQTDNLKAVSNLEDLGVEGMVTE